MPAPVGTHWLNVSPHGKFPIDITFRINFRQSLRRNNTHPSTKRTWLNPCDTDTPNILAIVELIKGLLQTANRTGASMDAVSNQNNKSDSAKRLVTSWLHPRVYAVLLGLTLWFVSWVWSFVGVGETDYLLFIVSGFIAIVVALQLVLSCVGRAPQATSDDTIEDSNKSPSFREWARGDFDTEHGRLSGADAAILILLPIAAAAIGMMTFGIEFQIVEHVGL